MALAALIAICAGAVPRAPGFDEDPLTPGVAPAQIISYEIRFLGDRVGEAQLTIERGPAGARYAFESALALSGSPCLVSREHETGTGRAGDKSLPEPLFVALAKEIGATCRDVTDGNARGRACWTHVNGRHFQGTLFGEPVTLELSPDGLPERLAYPRLGVIYRRGVAGSEDLCAPRRTDRGVVAPGGAGVEARSLEAAQFQGKAGAVAVQAERIPLPLAIAAAVTDIRARRLASCQDVARALGDRLRAAGIESRIAIGLLLDGGRYFPHAWNEVRVAGGWRAVDAAVGEGWADAGRIRAGLLDDFGSGLRLLGLLRAPPRFLRGE